MTAEKERKQGKEGTIVAVTNGPPQLNPDSCGFQTPLSITGRRINGLHLNDKTISHEQPISLSLGQGQFVCSSRKLGGAISSQPYGIWFLRCWIHPSIMTACVITKCLPLSPCYNWQRSAVTRDGWNKMESRLKDML